MAYRLHRFDYDTSVEKNVKLFLTNQEVDVCDALGRKGLNWYILPRLYPEMKDRIAWHRDQGHVLVLVTSAFDSVCRPVYEHLEFDHLCCTFIERKDGFFTGQAHMPLCHDQGKAYYIKKISERYHIDLDQSYAYADNISDLPMLEAVGNPIATNPDKYLRKKAHQNNWTIMDCKKPKIQQPHSSKSAS